jgi:hypothetical protein
LNHEVSNDAVELHPIIETLLNQEDEVVDRDGASFANKWIWMIPLFVSRTAVWVLVGSMVKSGGVVHWHDIHLF